MPKYLFECGDRIVIKEAADPKEAASLLKIGELNDDPIFKTRPTVMMWKLVDPIVLHQEIRWEI